MRINQKIYRKYVNRVKSEEGTQNYTLERKIAYLYLYEKLRIMLYWEKTPKDSISIEKLDRVLTEFLTPIERKCIESSFGLKDGKPKTFEAMEAEFQVSKIVLRNNVLEAIERIQNLACMDYISLDLMEIKKSPISEKWKGSIFDFSPHIAKIFMKSYIDLDRLASMNEERLRKIKGIGDASIKEIRAYFMQRGLQW